MRSTCHFYKKALCLSIGDTHSLSYQIMKRPKTLGWLITPAIAVTLIAGCRQADETIPESLSTCAEAQTVVHRISSITGTVGYHINKDQLTLSYYLPGTIDSQWTGVVCNLPAEYRVIGKRVTFRGEFRDAQKKLTPVFGGQEMYYLYLTDIKPL